MARLGVVLSLLIDDGLDSFNLGLLLKDAFLLLLVALLQLGLLSRQFCSAVLSLQLLSHCKGH